MNARRIGVFDLETDDLLPEATTIWCMVVKDVSDGMVHVHGPNDVNSIPNTLNKFDVLIGHNCIAFDFPILRKLLGYEYTGKKVDTLVMSRTQRPNRRTPAGCKSGPHSVAAWGVRLGNYKVENDVWDKFHEKIIERCIQDVEIQERIYNALLKEAAGENWMPAHRLNMRLFEILQKQEEYGWTFDSDKANEHIVTLTRWIDKVSDVINPRLPLKVDVLEGKEDGEYKYVKKPFNKNGRLSVNTAKYLDSNWSDLPEHSIVGVFSRVDIRPVDLNSNAEVKQFLLDEGWEPDEWNTNSNGERTSPKFSKDDSFSGIKSGLGKLIAKRIQSRQRLSTIQGWLEHVRDDGRIPTPIGGIATTGRLRHKVVVNVPSPHSKAFFARQMRELFIAKSGWKLIGCDSKGNQVRQLAARMGNAEFTQAVLFGKSDEGTDIHSINQRRSGAPSRSKAKNFFYGFIFGAQATTISKQVGCSIQEAKQLIENYLREMPDLVKLINDMTGEWRKSAQRYYNPKWRKMVYANGYITGLDGRPILVDSEHKILCYMLQSDEAIQMAAAYVKFYDDMLAAGYEWGRDWGFLIWYHDEYQFECRPEIVEHASKMAEEAITWAGEYFKIDCPHEGESIVGSNWYECH